MSKHPSPMSNSWPGVLVESGKWALAFFMGIAALAWLMVQGARDE